MNSAPGTRRDHNRFCQVEGWVEVRNARGQRVRHHITYELELPDGRILRTRFSQPANNTTYGPNLWSTILDHQLCVSEEGFWRCVKERRPPDRGQQPAEPLTNPLPAQLVFQLIHGAGVPEEQVATMTLSQAMEVLTAYWSRSPTQGGSGASE